jgi:hypothetical protein
MKNSKMKFPVFRKNRVDKNVETNDEVDPDRFNDSRDPENLDDDLYDDEDFDDYLQSRYEEANDKEEEDLLSI